MKYLTKKLIAFGCFLLALSNIGYANTEIQINNITNANDLLRPIWADHLGVDVETVTDEFIVSDINNNGVFLAFINTINQAIVYDLPNQSVLGIMTLTDDVLVISLTNDQYVLSVNENTGPSGSSIFKQCELNGLQYNSTTKQTSHLNCSAETFFVNGSSVALNALLASTDVAVNNFGWLLEFDTPSLQLPTTVTYRLSKDDISFNILELSIGSNDSPCKLVNINGNTFNLNVENYAMTQQDFPSVIFHHCDTNDLLVYKYSVSNDAYIPEILSLGNTAPGTTALPYLDIAGDFVYSINPLAELQAVSTEATTSTNVIINFANQGNTQTLCQLSDCENTIQTVSAAKLRLTESNIVAKRAPLQSLEISQEDYQKLLDGTISTEAELLSIYDVELLSFTTINDIDTKGTPAPAFLSNYNQFSASQNGKYFHVGSGSFASGTGDRFLYDFHILELSEEPVAPEELSIEVFYSPDKTVYAGNETVTISINTNGGDGDIEYRLIIKERVIGQRNEVAYRSQWQTEPEFIFSAKQLGLKNMSKYKSVVVARDSSRQKTKSKKRFKIQ